MFTAINDFFAKGYLNKNALSVNYDQANNDFGTGKCAMSFNGSWFPQAINGDPKFKDVQIGFLPLPDENGNAYMTSTITDCISVNVHSKFVNQGKDLIAALRDKSTYIPYLKDNSVPPFKDYVTDATFQGFKEYSDAFTKYPGGYQADQFIAPSAGH